MNDTEYYTGPEGSKATDDKDAPVSPREAAERKAIEDHAKAHAATLEPGALLMGADRFPVTMGHFTPNMRSVG